MVQSYLEGVGWGLEQLREARAELREVSHTLQKVSAEAKKSVKGASALENLQEVTDDHCQLLAAVSNLPRLYLGDWCTLHYRSDLSITVVGLYSLIANG